MLVMMVVIELEPEKMLFALGDIRNHYQLITHRNLDLYFPSDSIISGKVMEVRVNLKNQESIEMVVCWFSSIP